MHKILNSGWALAVVFVLLVGSFTWSQRQQNDIRQAADRKLTAKLCAAAIPSWKLRNELIHEVNEPTYLSPEIDPESTQGKALLAQINQSNLHKAERLKRDLALNGPLPCQ